jgi:nucleoside 2-deoxyribosyltransferase
MSLALNVYLAANGREIETTRKAMQAIRDAGHRITHDWTVGIENQRPADPVERERVRQAAALADVAGIRAADVLVLLDHDKGFGMYVEMGVAIGLGKPVIVVDERYHQVFFSLPTVRLAETVEQAIALLSAVSSEVA